MTIVEGCQAYTKMDNAKPVPSAIINEFIVASFNECVMSCEYTPGCAAAGLQKGVVQGQGRGQCVLGSSLTSLETNTDFYLYTF